MKRVTRHSRKKIKCNECASIMSYEFWKNTHCKEFHPNVLRPSYSDQDDKKTQKITSFISMKQRKVRCLIIKRLLSRQKKKLSIYLAHELQNIYMFLTFSRGMYRILSRGRPGGGLIALEISKLKNN